MIQYPAKWADVFSHLPALEAIAVLLQRITATNVPQSLLNTLPLPL